MIVIAILSTIVSVVWSLLVLFANGMSDAPGSGFQFGWTIILAWLATAALYIAWWVG